MSKRKDKKSVLYNAEDKPVIYIAGGMRGYPDFNFAAFDEARDFINARHSDFFPVSPADIDRVHGEFECDETASVNEDEFHVCMRRDLPIVASAKAILLLESANKSRGANIELCVANACGVEIYEALYLTDMGRRYMVGMQRVERSPEATKVGAVTSLQIAQSMMTTNTAGASSTYTIPNYTPDYSYFDAQGKIMDVHTEPEAECQVCLDREPELDAGPETIMEEANRIIYGPRQEAYGHPIVDFTRTGKMWAPIIADLDLSQPIPPERVGLMMVALKISRECNKPNRDNRVDGVGYFGCVDRIQKRYEEGLESDPS